MDTGKACERSAPEAHIYIQFVVTRVGNRCNQICDVFSSDKPITSFFLEYSLLHNCHEILTSGKAHKRKSADSPPTPAGWIGKVTFNVENN